MKKQWITTVVTITMVLGMFTGSANATDKYSAGAITWATGTDVWSTTSGGSYTGPWVSDDSATFEGTAGTVALGESISVSNITFNTGNYTISGHTLNFVSGGTIDSMVAGMKIQTISSGITGSPSVRMATGGHNPYRNQIIFAPDSIDQTLGSVYLSYEDADGGDKSRLTLSGTTSGNTVGDITNDPLNLYNIVEKVGTSTWTVGNINAGSPRAVVNISGGTLIADGVISNTITVSSTGQFHIKNTSAVNAALNMNGGFLDNVSGAAIVAPTYNPVQSWGGNWTFIGSGGVLSDLDLGTGSVTLTGNRTVTIQTAATTLTVGGDISDGASVFGLTKAGDGTLALTGTLDYNGITTVNAGTLSIGNGTTSGDLDDGALVDIASGAKLDLNFSGTDTTLLLNLGGSPVAAGTWGATGSGAANTNDAYFSGSGMINNLGGLGPDGEWSWDGTAGGTGDLISDGGDGTWSTSSANWDHGYVAKEAWDNSSMTNDKARFSGSGTVTLGDDITLKEIVFNTDCGNYTISGRTLNFVTNGLIDQQAGADKQIKFTSVINGSPNVKISSGGGYTHTMEFAPTNGSVTLGTCTVPYYDGGGDKCDLILAGTTLGNSVSEVIKEKNYAYLTKKGSSTWTVGDVSVGTLRIQDGILVLNGTMIYARYNMSFTGGALAGTGVFDTQDLTVPAGCTIAPGDPTGTLTVTNNNCTIEGTLAIEVNGASYSTLSVDPDNTLTISSATLDVNVTSAAGGPIAIATYGAGQLTGPFASENATAAGFTIEYGATAITLSPSSSGSLFRFR